MHHISRRTVSQTGFVSVSLTRRRREVPASSGRAHGRRGLRKPSPPAGLSLPVELALRTGRRISPQRPSRLPSTKRRLVRVHGGGPPNRQRTRDSLITCSRHRPPVYLGRLSLRRPVCHLLPLAVSHSRRLGQFAPDNGHSSATSLLEARTESKNESKSGDRFRSLRNSRPSTPPPPHEKQQVIHGLHSTTSSHMFRAHPPPRRHASALESAHDLRSTDDRDAPNRNGLIRRNQALARTNQTILVAPEDFAHLDWLKIHPS